MKKNIYKVILCHYLNPLSDTKCVFIKNAAVVLKEGQVGFKFLEVGQSSFILNKYKSLNNTIIIDNKNMLMLPSFFDMHFHWVQDAVREKPKAQLLKWLTDFTWPYEAKFKSKRFSKDKSLQFSKELIKFGTLGGACYSSIHKHSTLDAINNFRGDYIIGNVLMDMNSPKELLQTKKSALNIVQSLSLKLKKKYALTPRFALSTSPELMKESAKIAKSNGSFIQTHLSENTFEIKTILELYKTLPGFEKIKSYTHIYKKCNILGSKTLLGHGIHLDNEELEILSKTKTKLIHCPSSNAPVKEKGLGSGLFDFKKIEKMNIDWALGSDIGAGPFLSMFDVIYSYVSQNKKASIKGANYKKALYRSTLAGAEILKIDKKCGNLDMGKHANFIMIDCDQSALKNNAEQTLEYLIATRPKTRKKRTHLCKETYLLGERLFHM